MTNAPAGLNAPPINSLTFLGLDLSLTATGVAAMRADRTVLWHRVLRPTPRSLKDVERLLNLRDQLHNVLPPGPFVAAVEGYAIRALNRPYATGEWGGVARLALLEAGCAACVVPPLSLKAHATFHGLAEKETMIARARHLYGYTGKDDNESDALHLAAFAADWWQPRPDLNRKQVAAIEKAEPIFPPPFARPLPATRQRTRL